MQLSSVTISQDGLYVNKVARKSQGASLVPTTACAREVTPHPARPKCFGSAAITNEITGPKGYFPPL